jgi:hypothetical protein
VRPGRDPADAAAFLRHDTPTKKQTIADNLLVMRAFSDSELFLPKPFCRRIDQPNDPLPTKNVNPDGRTAAPKRWRA